MFSKEKIEIIIDGMKCKHCETRIKEALIKISGIRKITTNIKKKQVIVYYQINPSVDVIKKAIEDLGYKVLEIK